jgi:hypothetical protein
MPLVLRHLDIRQVQVLVFCEVLVQLLDLSVDLYDPLGVGVGSPAIQLSPCAGATTEATLLVKGTLSFLITHIILGRCLAGVST